MFLSKNFSKINILLTSAMLLSTRWQWVQGSLRHCLFHLQEFPATASPFQARLYLHHFIASIYCLAGQIRAWFLALWMISAAKQLTNKETQGLGNYLNYPASAGSAFGNHLKSPRLSLPAFRRKFRGHFNDQPFVLRTLQQNTF